MIIIKASDYIVEFLINKGVTDIFGYPGGMVTHLMDSLDKYKDKINTHLNYHEQAAAFAACGYAQASHKVGVAYATSGPGATNLITGIAEAYFDSIPCLFITGQVNTYESKGKSKIRQKGFQETNIVNIVQEITKYSVQITKTDELEHELKKAFSIAISGRPGPVLLDIPMDIQKSELNNLKLNDNSRNNYNKIYKDDYEVIYRQLCKSIRPCILIGNGIKLANVVNEFRNILSISDIPIVSSMLAVDILERGKNNYYGFIGAYGDRTANYIVAKCDLLITIGSRLDCRQTANIQEFAPNALLIRIDIDETELDNVIKENEIQIIDDIRNKQFLKYLKTIFKTREMPSWNKWICICKEIKHRLNKKDESEIGKLIKKFSKSLSQDLIITTDVGQNQIWIAQYFHFKSGQQFISSGGHGAMGYSIPSAIGAYYGSNNNILCFCGDGGFQMNIQELQFIFREQLPIKIIVFNNYSLGMIRHFQEMYFNSNYVQTKNDKGYTVPSFKKISKAYGIEYKKISCKDKINMSWIENNKPMVIEIVLNDNTYVYPKLGVGHPIQDQEPYIDRKEFEYLMKL